MEITHPKRRMWEDILLIVVFAAMMAFIVNSYFVEQRAYRQRALFYQLTIMRQGLNIFDLVEKRFPDNLIELAISTYKLPGDNATHRFIERIPISREGKVVDPFGNPYVYEKAKGWVMSSTQGYSFW